MPRPPALILLVLLFGGLLAAGLRSPWLWSGAGVLLWAMALAHPEALAASPGPRWGLFLLWACVCAALSSQPWNGLELLSTWAGAAAFLLLARRLWGEGEKRLWFWGLCAAAFALAAAALVSGASASWEAGTMTGLLPPYYNYTAFAVAAGAAAAFAASGHPRLPSGRARVFLQVLAGLLTVVLLLARARGAFLALCASALLTAWRRGRLRALARPLAFAAAAAAAVTAVMAVNGGGAAYLLKLDKAFKRPQLWAASLAAAAESPLAGEGPGNFAVGFRRHVFPAELTWGRFTFSTAHAHSEVLQVLCETGAVGLGLFLWALAGGLKGAAKGESPWTQDAALGAWAAMSFHLLVDNALHRPGLALLYFSAAACASPAPSSWRLPARWAAPLARGAALLALGLSLAAWYPRWRVSDDARRAAAAQDPARRVALVSEAVRILPAEPGLREDLARAWLAAAPPRPDLALAELREAGRLEPTNAWRLMMRAQILWTGGDRAAAAALAEEALALEPRFLGARLLRAHALADAGRRAEAAAERAELGRLAEMTKAPGGAGIWYGYDRRLAELPPGALETFKP